MVTVLHTIYIHPHASILMAIVKTTLTNHKMINPIKKMAHSINFKTINWTAYSKKFQLLAEVVSQCSSYPGKA